MNDYLCILNPARAELVDAPSPDEIAAVQAHFAYVQGLVAAGVCRLAGRTDAMGLNTIGIVLYRAVSLEAAKALVNNDPAVARGVMQSSVYPFNLALLAESVIE